MNVTKDQIKNYIEKGLHELKVNLSSLSSRLGKFSISSNIQYGQEFKRPNSLQNLLQRLQPLVLANLIRNLLIFISVATLAYTFFLIDRLPTPLFSEKSAQIYQFQDLQKASAIFGQKEIDLSQIRLTGISKGNNPSNSFAVFEVSGKNTGAIAIGEVFDAGYFLKNITEDSVDIVYLGKSYQISLIGKDSH
jgi:hypothetical protein